MNASDRIARKREELADGRRITVGELRKQLSGYPDDAEIVFSSTLAGAPLVFYRVKNRGPVGGFLAQIELNEIAEEDAREALRQGK